MKKQAKKRMTVGDLIDALGRYDPDLPVRTFNSNGDEDEPLMSVVMKNGEQDCILISAVSDD